MSNDSKQTSVKDGSVVVAAVEELGLLLVSDPKRKSALQILTGEPPRGSWWTHPEANHIYDILQTLERHPDLLFAKLLSGKVTTIHRALWPAFLAVVTAREAWQVENLSPNAERVVASLDAGQSLESEAEPVSRTLTKEIEARLLARAESVHGSSGHHATRLESWTSWAARVGCPSAPSLSVAQAKLALETAAARLGPPPPALPWKASTVL